MDKWLKITIVIMVTWLIISAYLFYVLNQWWVILGWIIPLFWLTFGGTKEYDDENIEER
jgi:hypothetical protein